MTAVVAYHSHFSAPKIWDPAIRVALLTEGALLVPLPSTLPTTILVIEDDTDVRRVVRRSLELEGYAVLEAGDGEEGLGIVDRNPDGLDLVLTDIDMPKIDGITVAKVLSERRPHLGVICMSGSLGKSVFEQSLGIEAHPFLSKPFTFADLAQKTAETLARPRTSFREISGRQNNDDLVAAAHKLRARAAWANAPLTTSGQLPHDMESHDE